jgi:TRAP-type C4-dicarboxylate transport system substrate-binding protein
MRKGLWVFLVLFVVSLVPCAVSGQTIVLKAVTAFPKTHLNNDPVPAFVEDVNKRAQGKLRIDWLGGPEVFAAFDQITALKAGTVDMILYYPFGYMKSLMPEADAKGLSELAEWEERKSGAFEVWTEIFEKRVNAKLSGQQCNFTSQQKD